MKKASKRKKGKPKNRTTALVKVEKPALLARPPESAIPTVSETVENLERVRRFISKCLNTDLQKKIANLKPGETLTKQERARLEIDWGTIPGVDKPFLLQPGAEKFLFWLNLRPHYRIECFELAGGHLEVVSSCTIYHKKTKEIVFEGPQCSCSTMESNYRFRWVKRENAPKPTPEEAAQLKGQGLGKWRKEYVWAHGRRTDTQEFVWYDRQDNPNISDERNKVRQMSQKRALVKVVRNMGALSEIFTSDPSEWQIPEEEEGDPYQEQQYTEHGRRIINGGNGEPSTGSKEAAEAVAARKIAEAQARKPAREPGDDSPAVTTIESVKEAKTKKGQTYLLVRWNGREHGCFHADLFDSLRAGVGLEAELVTEVNGQYSNVTGIFKIGRRQFDGVSAILAADEMRPKNQRELF